MNQRPPRDEQKKALLQLATKLAPRPMLIGPGAVHLGWWATLPETEALLEEMVRDGTLRHASRQELSASGLRFGYLPV